ncbi:MAG TPA: response regulator [Pirellulales bacterium]|jgi:FixJ family two-component response regulator|nr:response regulator [Pirellulales bacterium]
MSTATLNQTVIVVDDDPAARDSVAALVQSQSLPVQTFSSAENFLENFDRSQRGVMVLDVRMTGKTGVELLEQLQSEGFALPVIIITGFANVPLAVRAMRAGAYSFLEKGGSEQELWTTVQEALQWEARSRERETLRQEIRQHLAELTSDEQRVLDRLVDGMPNKVIAAELDIGLRTVELRRATILKKMNARSLAELVRFVLIAQDKDSE